MPADWVSMRNAVGPVGLAPGCRGHQREGVRWDAKRASSYRVGAEARPIVVPRAAAGDTKGGPLAKKDSRGTYDVARRYRSRNPLQRKAFSVMAAGAPYVTAAGDGNRRHILERCHLNETLHVCTMTSDHCGLLRTPSAVPA